MKRIFIAIIACTLVFCFMTMPVGAMQIYVKTPAGKNITIEVDPGDTIGYLKEVIEDRENIAQDLQKLIYAGNELDSTETLGYYNIQKEFTLYLALRGENRTDAVKDISQSNTSDVYGKYVAGATSDTVYSVDITWGAMEFTYTAGSKGEWNPENHSYTGQTDAVWSVDVTDGNKITVTNHSNTGITATLTYEQKSGFTDIDGSFTENSGTADDGILTLPTAEGSLTSDAPVASANFSLSGDLDNGIQSKSVIGTIKISLS